MTEEERAAEYQETLKARYEWAKNNISVTLAGDPEAAAQAESDWDAVVQFQPELAAHPELGPLWFQ